jgi:acyl-coenzyme A thioesterase PaaI-like protein
MPAPLRTADELATVLNRAFPPSSPDAAMRVEHLDARSIRLRAPVGDRPLRPGDTVSGPTLFAVADAVAWMMTLAHLEPGRDAVTSGVTMQFLRRPQPLDLVGEGRLLKQGRRLTVTDVLLYSDGGADPVAQATVTYAPL